MFSSFRGKLLFWFLLLVCSNILIVWLTMKYLKASESVVRTAELTEAGYIFLLKDVKAQQDFFSQETKNVNYFRSGKSPLLEKHRILYDSTKKLISSVLQSNNADAFGIKTELTLLQLRHDSIDDVFYGLVSLINRRGFKDMNLEGSMRAHAHWLEKQSNIAPEKILSLRRHEKDYIIRNETVYVEQLNELADVIRLSLITAQTSSKRDSVLEHLDGYREDFNKVVTLDRRIGIKDNTALKHELDQLTEEVEASFNNLVEQAAKHQQELQQELTVQYIIVVSFVIGISIIVSFLISGKITRPLRELTTYITKFVESGFSEKMEYRVRRTGDEIGVLSGHFDTLRHEVISHLKFFKDKVEERTRELAFANQKLVSLNQANSRFVPKEFLQFLSKDSIEDVMLGDQVEHEMTVMFTDIRSFTKISESLTPQENFDFINGYLKEIVPVIRKHHGFIDKYIGDSVMALFPGPPDAALLAALEFEKAVDGFNEYLVSKGLQPIVIGSGIHTGRLILGTIGNDQRLETTVISDSVNIASRMEGLTKIYHCNIIVTEETADRLEHPENFYLRYLDTVQVKGKSKSLSVYAVLGTEEGNLRKSYQTEFQEAISLLKNNQLEESRNRFIELSLRYPEDGVVAVFLQRCDKFKQDGFPENWNGVHILDGK